MRRTRLRCPVHRHVALRRRLLWLRLWSAVHRRRLLLMLRRRLLICRGSVLPACQTNRWFVINPTTHKSDRWAGLSAGYTCKWPGLQTAQTVRWHT